MNKSEELDLYTELLKGMEQYRTDTLMPKSVNSSTYAVCSEMKPCKYRYTLVCTKCENNIGQWADESYFIPKIKEDKENG